MDEALYDEKADFWSVGCILYEAHFGRPPIKTQSFSQLLKWLRNPEIVWPSPISAESRSFVEGLLKKEPRMRLTWTQIIEHPYVRNNLLILDNNKPDRPLTEDLTTSQLIRKEKQRDEIIFNRGKKMIAEAMSKCQAKNNEKLVEVRPQPQPNQKRKQSNVIGDNESISSDDSVNAIIQTDLETDVEGPLIKKEIKPPTEIEPIADREENQNLIIQRYTDNFAAPTETDEQINANLNVGTLMENMEKMQLEDENKWYAAQGKPISTIPPKPVDDANISEAAPTKANTELVRRKLSQNLDNFSIRLGNDRNQKQSNESNKDSSKEKSQWFVLHMFALPIFNILLTLLPCYFIVVLVARCRSQRQIWTLSKIRSRTIRGHQLKTNR